MEAKTIYALTGDRLEHYWLDIAALLFEVPGFCECYSVEWAFERAKMGHLQVWALADDKIRAIVLTQIAVFPRCNVFEILAAGGVGLMDFMNEMEDVFMRIAYDNGCSVIQARCRPGLEKALKRRGAWKQSVVLSKPVQRQGDQ